MPTRLTRSRSGGAQNGEGVEYHLLALALALPLLVRGGGLFSIDAALAAHPRPGAAPLAYPSPT